MSLVFVITDFTKEGLIEELLDNVTIVIITSSLVMINDINWVDLLSGLMVNHINTQ